MFGWLGYAAYARPLGSFWMHHVWGHFCSMLSQQWPNCEFPSYYRSGWYVYFGHLFILWREARLPQKFHLS